MTGSKPLRVAVCIKQVPVSEAIEFDEESGTIRRDGVPSEVNSDDVRAVLAAVETRKLNGGEVVVVTMGPPDAAQALRYCMALGADRAVHLSDRAFAGSDTLATAHILAAALDSLDSDVVLCGRSSTDAETGNIGPEIAELLDVPQVTNVTRFDVDAENRTIIAERDIEHGVETVQVTVPSLLVVSEDVAAEVSPSKDDLASFADAPVKVVTAADLGGDPESFGFAGSPTSVIGTTTTSEVNREHDVAEGELSDNVEAAYAWLATRLSPVEVKAGVPLPSVCGERPQSIAVFVEVDQRGVRQVSRELLAAAVELSDPANCQVDAILIGNGVRKYSREVSSYGADRIRVVEDERLASGDPVRMVRALELAVAAKPTDAVLFPSTVLGRDLAPRYAARAKLGLTADCIALTIDDGVLVQHKPAFGDGLVAEITSSTSPALATVRPGIYVPMMPQDDRQAILLDVPLGELPNSTYEVLNSELYADVDDLTAADVVIGVGMGAVSSLEHVHVLAEHLGAAVGCTRKVADAGIVGRNAQIGLTGHAISPTVYLVIGSRGAYEHVVGIRRAAHVIAFDIDEESFMFDHSDLGVVGDCAELLPALIARLDIEPITHLLKEESCTPESLNTA